MAFTIKTTEQTLPRRLNNDLWETLAEGDLNKIRYVPKEQLMQPVLSLSPDGQMMVGNPITLVATSGRLDTLKFLHSLGVLWDESTSTAAVVSGSLECLEYVHQNGCPINSDKIRGILGVAPLETYPWGVWKCMEYFTVCNIPLPFDDEFLKVDDGIVRHMRCAYAGNRHRYSVDCHNRPETCIYNYEDSDMSPEAVIQRIKAVDWKTTNCRVTKTDQLIFSLKTELALLKQAYDKCQFDLKAAQTQIDNLRNNTQPKQKLIEIGYDELLDLSQGRNPDLAARVLLAQNPNMHNPKSKKKRQKAKKKIQKLKSTIETEKKNIEKEKQAIEEEKICIICMEHPRSHAFEPCGHLACCTECSTKLTSHCPVCKALVKRTIKIYTA